MRPTMTHTPILAATIVGLALLASACGSANNGGATNTNARPPAASTIQTVAGGAPAAVKTAVAGLVQQIDQLATPVKGANSAQVKQQAVDGCHGLRDQVKGGSAIIAGQVDQICTQIQNTNPDDKAAWGAVKQQLQALKAVLGA